jgi:hypothetical protein
MLLHTYFYPHRRGGPLLQVMDNCPVLWHQLTSLARGIEPHDVEDLEPHQVDHGADALRYWAQGRPKPSAPTPGEILEHDPDVDKMLDARSYEVAKIERERAEARKRGFGKVPVRQKKPRIKQIKKPWG